MARNLNPQCKQCRREGVKLFLKGDRCNSSKCALIKRNYVPGMHGQKIGKGGSRLTGYGLQLREKQKCKKTYGILEAQLRKYFKEAKRKPGNTGDFLFTLIETRLDNAVYESGFGINRNLARQMVNHGHILVNGKKVTIPSYKVRIKDKISVNQKSLKKALFAEMEERLKKKVFPDWIAMDFKNSEATIIDLPKLEKIKPNFDIKAIVEFYSK